MHHLIKQYISKLTIENVKEFLITNNIYLDEMELNYVFNLVKKDYNFVLDKKYDIVLKKLSKIRNFIFGIPKKI